MSKKEKLHSKISKLAYKFFIMRNQKHGYALEDWLNAENIERGNLWGKIKIWLIINAGLIASIVSFFVVLGIILSFRASCISIEIAQKNLTLTHNAVLFVQGFSLSQTDGKTYIQIKNSGKTNATNVQLGCFLLYFPDSNPIPEEKDHVSNPGKLIFYPEQIYSLPLNGGVDFNKQGFFFLVIYVQYTTVDKSIVKYKGIFQYESGNWLEVGIDQKSIEIYKEGIKTYLDKLEKLLE